MDSFESNMNLIFLIYPNRYFFMDGFIEKDAFLYNTRRINKNIYFYLSKYFDRLIYKKLFFSLDNLSRFQEH